MFSLHWRGSLGKEDPYNGRGFRNDQSMASHTVGFGLSGIDQRVKMLGGGLTIDSAPDAGTTISVTIPLRTKHP